MGPSFPPAFAGAVAGVTEFKAITLKIVPPAKAGAHGHSVEDSANYLITRSTSNHRCHSDIALKLVLRRYNPACFFRGNVRA